MCKVFFIHGFGSQEPYVFIRTSNFLAEAMLAGTERFYMFGGLRLKT